MPSTNTTSTAQDAKVCHNPTANHGTQVFDSSKVYCPLCSAPLLTNPNSLNKVSSVLSQSTSCDITLTALRGKSDPMGMYGTTSELPPGTLMQMIESKSSADKSVVRAGESCSVACTAAVDEHGCTLFMHSHLGTISGSSTKVKEDNSFYLVPATAEEVGDLRFCISTSGYLKLYIDRY